MRRIVTPLLLLAVVLLDSFGTSFLVPLRPLHGLIRVGSSSVRDARSAPMATSGVVLITSITSGITTTLCAAPYQFEMIRSLDSRLEKLEVAAPDILGSFYEPHLKSFSVVPGSVNVSVPRVLLHGLGWFAHQTTGSRGGERERLLSIFGQPHIHVVYMLGLTHHVSGNRD